MKSEIKPEKKSGFKILSTTYEAYQLTQCWENIDKYSECNQNQVSQSKIKILRVSNLTLKFVSSSRKLNLKT